MSINKKNKHYTDEKKYIVYVILHPHTKECFIHFSATTALKNAMKQNYTLKNIYTKDMFEEHKETIYPPEMYALEETEMTRADCFIKKILWIRYFMDNGYLPLNHEDDVSSAQNLFEENIADYEEIKRKNLEDVLGKANRRFPHYGRERMDKDPEEKSGERKQMKFFCSEEEYEIIKQNAKKRKQTISAFIRDVSTNTISIQFNYDAILQHTNEINQIKSELNAIITMLVQTNQAYPIDIEKIILLLDEINNTEKLMLQQTSKERQQLKKYIKKIIST